MSTQGAIVTRTRETQRDTERQGQSRVESRAPRSFVRRGVHHRVDLRRVAHLNLHEPAVGKSGFVHHARRIGQVFVNLDDFAAHRGVDVGRRLDGFHDAERTLRLDFAPDFGKFNVHDVAQFSLVDAIDRSIVHSVSHSMTTHEPSRVRSVGRSVTPRLSLSLSPAPPRFRFRFRPPPRRVVEGAPARGR